jgi:hypothetical protein
LTPENPLFASPEKSLELSIERYSPMLWLLSNRRLRRMRLRGGLAREFKIRARRAGIFARYLSALRTDFRQTCDALKLVLVLSPKDRPELASVLFRAELTFDYGVLLVTLRLLRYRCGL